MVAFDGAVGSLVPRPSTPPVFDHLQYAKMERTPGESFHSTTVIYCHASSQQLNLCTRPILHSALATKMVQEPTESYTERMKQTKKHDSEGLPSDKHENAQL